MLKEIKLNGASLKPILQKTKTVELIGPPGIGKSTIYKALSSSRNKNASWVTQDIIFQIEEPKITQAKKWFEYQIRSLIKKKELRSPSIDQGVRFLETYKELGKFLWNHLSDTSLYSEAESNLRFPASYFLFRDFCRYQQIWASQSIKPCIIDEGFLQKSFLTTGNYIGDENLIRDYLGLLPHPQAIIYVNTNDNNIILDRLLNRDKIIASHIGKNSRALQTDIENWQKLFRIILRQAKQEHKIPVFYLDGASPISENVRNINQIMNNISSL